MNTEEFNKAIREAEDIYEQAEAEARDARDAATIQAHREYPGLE